MPNQDAKKNNGMNAVKGNGLGPVAREKYETILQSRVRRCIAAEEAKIRACREEALRLYLEQNNLVSKMATYRAILEDLIGTFGEPDWRSPAWLRDDTALLNHPRVEKGVRAVLQEMPKLRPAFAELERLRQFEAQVTEKVWLAGAPEEIAELLKEIGEPSPDASAGDTR